MAKRMGISRRLQFVINGVNDKMAKQNEGRSHVFRGLNSEGWEAGYRQALSDVLLSLSGVTDCNGRHEDLWREALGVTK